MLLGVLIIASALLCVSASLRYFFEFWVDGTEQEKRFHTEAQRRRDIYIPFEIAIGIAIAIEVICACPLSSAITCPERASYTRPGQSAAPPWVHEKVIPSPVRA